MTALLSSSATGAYRAGEEVITITKRPAAYTSSTRGVIAPHGKSVTAESVRDPQYIASSVLLAGADLPVFAFDFGDPTLLTGTTSGPSSWGNDNAIAAFADAVTWLTAEGANKTFGMGAGCATGSFFIAGGSMAAIVALNYLVSLATPANVCAGLAITIPTLDLDDIYQNDKGGWRSEIGEAYGVTFPTALPNLATHSPVAYSAPNKAKLTMPIRIWASRDDTVASTTAQCQTWASSVGSNVSVVDLGAQGHTNTGKRHMETVQFFQGIA